MRLFIAEKPSLAGALADVLPGPHKRAANHIECGGGNTVARCAGHVLEMAPPEAYSPDFKAWRLEHLPIVPKEWKLEVSKPRLVKSLKALLKKAKRVVHAVGSHGADLTSDSARTNTEPSKAPRPP
jgi:DNA topoisomerase-3